MKYLFFLLFIMSGIVVKSQTDDHVPKIFSSSPTAFKFSNYGNIPLNNSTGSFSYNLPLYEIKHNDILIPVALNYNSSGVKIDELSGIVGTDWNLSAGSIVSRIVRGVPDEKAIERWYPENINIYNDYVKIQQAGDESSSFAISGIDTEPDWFSFNINGKTGNFYLDENFQPILNSDSFFKIDFILGNYSSGFGLVSTIVIYDESGYKYVFGGDENFLEGNMYSNDCQTNGNPKLRYYSAWYLKEIISPLQSKVTFTYSANNFAYTSGVSFNYVFEESCNCYGGSTHPSYTSKLSDCLNYNNIQSKIISSINFGNNKLIFNYLSDRNDNGGKYLSEISVLKFNDVIKNIKLNYDEVINTQNHNYFKLNSDNSLRYRLFLMDVEFYDPINFISKYSFEYNNKDLLPIRLSFNKDLYGFSNQKNNLYPLSKMKVSDEFYYIIQSYGTPAYLSADLTVNPNSVFYGMLKKITFPTTGFSEIMYEANSTTKLEPEGSELHKLLKLKKECNYEDDGISTHFNFISNGSQISFNGYVDLIEDDNDDCLEALNHHANLWRIEVKNLSTNSIIYHRTVNFNEVFNTNNALDCISNSNNNSYLNNPICTENGVEYQVIFTITSKEFNPAEGDLNIHYNASTTMVEKPFYGGGARVKEIKEFDGSNFENTRKFYYNELNNINLQKTTLNQFQDPRYYEQSSIVKKDICIRECGCLDLPDPDMSWCLNYAIAANDSKDRFEISSSSFENLFNNRKNNSYYTAVTEIFEGTNKNGAIENIYKFSNDIKANPILLPFISSSPYSNHGDSTYGLIDEINYYEFKNPNSYEKKKQIKYNYYQLGYNNLKGYVFKKNYSTLLMPVPDNFVDNYSITQYHNISVSRKIKDVTERLFFDNSNIENLKSFDYSLQPYFNLESETLTNSDGKTYVTNYTYAPDLIGIEQAPYMQNLTDANRVSEPVITETFVKEGVINKKLSETHIKYANDASTGNLLLPKEIHSSKGIGNINITTIENRKVTYTKYSINGNIMEYKLEDGTPVSIIWGYDEQYPIAKVEGKTYVEIQSLADVLILDSNSSWGLQPSNFNNLRALEGALVTSYIYKPLVGVTSITMPNGSTEYYEYDEMGRLKEVKNSQGEVIRKMEYHYKPN